MFFEQEKVESLLNCNKCNIRLDVPKLLPCGYSICTYCVTSIIVNDNSVFDCSACSNTHQFPKDGFPINQSLIKFLSLKSDEVYRGEKVEQLKKKLREIETLISSLTFASENASDQINEHCIDLRTQIDLVTETTIEQINAISQKLHRQVNNYQQNTIKALDFKHIEKLNIKKKIDQLKIFHQNCSSYLKKLRLNDLDVQKLNLEGETLHENANKDLKSFEKNVIFNGNKIEFNKSDQILSDDFLGKIINKKSLAGSKILNNKQIIEFMNLEQISGKKEWSLIYRATEDGFGTNDFISKCSGKIKTFTIIKYLKFYYFSLKH